MDNRRSKSTPWLILGVAVIGYLLFWRSRPQPTVIQQITEPSPSPEIVLNGQSADGKISLVLTQKPAAETNTWTLTSAKAAEPAQTIWWLTAPKDTLISIPLNAVSPDNKYLFLKQKQAAKTDYLVLTVSGAALTKNSQTVNLAELFAQKYPDYQITEATGWGGINLIVFNTAKIGGTSGPSFWLELPSLAFIRLSNRFN